MNFNLEARHPDTLLHLDHYSGRRLAVLEDADFRWLEIDDVVQSVLCRTTPEALCLPHLRMVQACLPDKATRMLELGLGGGDMTRHLAARWPGAEHHCVELDREVLELYRRFFQGGEQPTLHHADALAYLEREEATFDLILLDLFGQDGNPPLMFQPALYQALARRLGGTLLVNLLPRTRLELERVLHLCAEHLGEAELWPVPGYRNIILSLVYD